MHESHDLRLDVDSLNGEFMEEKSTKINKYHNQSLFVWVVVLFLTYFLGQNIFASSSGVFGNQNYTYAIISIIIGYLLGTLFYELGKLIFGKIAGYKLVYFNYLGFTFIKNNQSKTRFTFTKFSNYGGKTVMSPKNEKSSLNLYLLGGTIFSVLMTILMLVGSHLLAKQIKDETIIYIEYIIASINLIILIFNMAPFLNDEFYDGFIFRIVNKNKDFKKVYQKMLLEEDALITGRGELYYFENIDYSNPLYGRASIYNYYYFLNQQKVLEAEQALEEGLKNTDYLNDEEIGLLNSGKYYFALLKGDEDKIGEEFYTLEKSIRKIATSYHNYETIKTALLVAALVDSSFDLYEYILNRMEKEKINFSPLRVETETKLIEDALNHIQKKKVDWFREDNNLE